MEGAANGVTEVAHYLDDFVVLGPLESPVCCEHLTVIMQICEELGFPLAMDKTGESHNQDGLFRHQDR